MGARRRGRILAFQALYSHEMSGCPPEDLLGFPWLDEQKLAELPEDTKAFARLIIQGTIENLASVDGHIRRQLEHWDFDRLGRVDLAILRMSVYCLLHQPDIPPSVTIDEAVDIAKDFGTDDSYRFINGVLDGIRRQAKL